MVIEFLVKYSILFKTHILCNLIILIKQALNDSLSVSVKKKLHSKSII